MSRYLPMQIAALTHIIAYVRNDVEPEVIASAEAGVASLSWIERNTSVIHEVKRLINEDPAVITILREFPGGRVRISGS
jgi:hypothetical protein